MKVKTLTYVPKSNEVMDTKNCGLKNSEIKSTTALFFSFAMHTPFKLFFFNIKLSCAGWNVQFVHIYVYMLGYMLLK